MTLMGHEGKRGGGRMRWAETGEETGEEVAEEKTGEEVG